MAERNINMEALIDSTKVLYIICIITISISSLMLLIKLIRQQNTASSVRRWMMIVLSMGSILLALFSLVINVRTIYDFMSIPCRTKVTSEVYQGSYFPFVYATGLLALSVELFLRTRGYQATSLPVKLIYIALPWIFGLVFVLPLNMAGIQWEPYCAKNFTPSQVRAQVVVNNLIPAILVMISSIVVYILTPHENQSGNFPVNYLPHDHRAGIIITSLPPKQSDPLPPPFQSGPYQHHHHQQQQQQHQHQHQQQHPPGVGVQSTLPSTHNQQYYYPSPPSYAPYGQTPPMTTSTIQTTEPSASSVRNLRKEALVLLRVSVVYFVLSLPLSIYFLATYQNRHMALMDPLAQLIISMTVAWLSLFRWVALSLCWFFSDTH